MFRLRMRLLHVLTCLLLATAFSFHVQCESLMIYTFDDGVGSMIAVDASPNGNDLTLNNMDTNLAWVEGKHGYVGDSALEFDGVNDYAYAPYDPSMNCDTQMTIECWLYLNPGVAYSLVGERSDVWRIAVNANAKVLVAYYMQSGPSGWVDTGEDPSRIGEWHHIAAIYDGEYFRLYLDGVEVDSAYIGTPGQ